MTTKPSAEMLDDDAREFVGSFAFDGDGDYTVFLSSPWDFDVLSIETQCGTGTSASLQVKIDNTAITWTDAAGTTLSCTTTADMDTPSSGGSAEVSDNFLFSVSSFSGSDLLFVNVFCRRDS